MNENFNSTNHQFIDFKASYDSIEIVKFYDSMSSFGILEKLLKITRMTNVSCQVRVYCTLSQPITINKGFRLICLTFNIALKMAINDSGANTTHVHQSQRIPR